jgi:hypothetical protein
MPQIEKMIKLTMPLLFAREEVVSKGHGGKDGKRGGCGRGSVRDLALPEGPAKIVAIGAVGQFRLALQALEILLGIAVTFAAAENPLFLHGSQVLMGLGAGRFLVLFVAKGADGHSHYLPLVVTGKTSS